MTIENIAVVRATNVIPIDGVIVPVSEALYIKKSTDEPFANEMVRLLKRKGIISPMDYSKIEDKNYMEEKNKEIAHLSSDYIPYTSNYNSMVLFSLNGIVPDDIEAGFGNNVFSDKKCAIIDDLSAHIDNVVSLNPTDTAIKGKVELSDNAIILIDQNIYDALSVEDKAKLNRFEVKPFQGNLKTAVNYVLSRSKKYTAETLALSSSKGGYIESPTSEELKQTIRSIAEEKNISTAYHMNILLHNTEMTPGLLSVQNEHENILKIKSYYQNEFYKFLFSEMPIEPNLQYCLLNFSSDTYIEQLCEAISDFGIDNYKNICAKYNLSLEALQQRGVLPTPQNIIDSINKEMPIDLCEMIRNFNMGMYDIARDNYKNEEMSKIQIIQDIKSSELQKGKSI